MSKWTTSAITSENPPPVLWAAKYEAIVTSKLAHSSFEINDAVPPAELERVLAIAPEWAPDGWPPPQLSPDVLALSKIKALLDFDAQSEAASSVAIRSMIKARFPQLETARGMKAFRVRSIVRLQDGQAEWEVAVPEAGTLPPGFEDIRLESGSALKVFLQNTVRADVLERLGR